MVIAPFTFAACILATFIFGYLVGDRPRLPTGWRWIAYDEGTTLVLYNDRMRVIEIHQLDRIRWHVGTKDFESLTKAKKHALRMVQ